MKLKLNITVRLIGYLVVVSVLPLLIFAISSYDVVRQTLIDLATESNRQLVVNQRDYLQSQQEQIENLAIRIAGIEEIGEIAARSDAQDDKKSDSYDALLTQAQIRQSLNLYSTLKGIVSIDLFTAKGHRFYVGDTLSVPPVNDQVRLAIYRSGLSAPKSIQWLGVQDNLNPDSPARKVLTALKIIEHYSTEKKSAEPVGMILINYSTDYLSEHFRSVDLGKDTYLVVSDSMSRLIYHPDPAKIGTALPPELHRLAQSEPQSASMTLGGRASLVSVVCLKIEPWCVYGVVPQETLLTPMIRITQTAAFLMVLCFIVIGVASRLFQRNVVVPIQLISDGIKRIQRQKNIVVEALPVPKNQDEIRELVIWFNAFSVTLKERQRYEKEIQESQYKFASIFKRAPLPLGLVRVENGEFVDVNDYWLRQFGFAREEVVGHTSFELEIWVDLSERRKMLEQISANQFVHELEIRQRCKDGKILVCLLSGSPVEIQNNRLFIFSPVDITRQREMEAEIQQINRELESRVLSRTLKLEQANQELSEAMQSLQRAKGELVRSEKMAALGSLVAGIAHELNTPVGNSVTVASTMQDETAALRQALSIGNVRRTTLEHYLDTVAKGAELLMRNLGNARELIASFKQVAADQSSNQRRTFELKNTLEGVLVTLVPMYKKTGYRMECALQEGIKMDSYPGPLGQIITNFVTNALSHAFEGRPYGTMHLQCHQRDSQYVEISFSDDGHGIPEENLTRVFDPFFTTKLGQGGSGLGLNIVYNIVTGVLGGTIRVESVYGHGTTFVIVLPMKAPAIAPGPA